MKEGLGRALTANFLGQAPDWYKLTIAGFLVLNPLVAFTAGPFVAGWLLVAEFIFTLAMALKCYPLQPGGLLAIEAVVMGLTSAEAVYRETEHNFPVILLLIFVVAGIWFLRDMLLFVFGRILLGVRSKRLLALLFCAAAAFLSAFLDALTAEYLDDLKDRAVWVVDRFSDMTDHDIRVLLSQVYDQWSREFQVPEQPGLF